MTLPQRKSSSDTLLDAPALPRDEKKLREALEAAQRLSAIVSSSEDAIVSKDLRGIVSSWNAAAERMFGYTAEEMIGQSILKIIPPELHSDEDRILGTIARGERIQHFETVRLRKGGERFDISLTISPVKDNHGRIVGAAKIARDITQWKKTQAALRTTERLASVGRLAATVAHEINNPLEALTNLIYLARTAVSYEEVQKYLASAEEELGRVSMITRQTLGFYRETEGPSASRVGAIAKSTLAVFATRIKNKGIELVTQIEDDPQIEVVPGEIRQLVANLVGNSIDAVKENGRIWLRVSASAAHNGNGGVRLTVADNGTGIPKSVRSRLFEPFFTTKRDVGTGLGLWVCQNIVRKHAGSIRLKTATDPARHGTVFSIFLPCSPPRPEASA